MPSAAAPLPAAPLPAEARRLLALAWPVMLTSLNWTMLQVIDIVIIGEAGTHEVAGFGASRTITFITIMIAIGALSGILVNASRADGAGDKAATGDVLREGLLLGAIIGLAGFALLFLLAGPMLAAIGVAEGVRPIATDVIRIVAFAFPAQMIMIAASNWLEGISRPRIVTVVNLTMLPVNGGLAWLLTGGQFGLPAMGAAGAALATTIVLWLGAVAMIVACRRVSDADARTARDFSLAAFRRAPAGAWLLARFGLIPGLASGLELAGFSYLIALSTQLGDVTAHAFQIVFAIHNVTFGVALGLGSAAGVRVGNAIGEGAPDRARARALIAAGLAFVLEGAIVVALIAAGGSITALFPATPAVHAMAAAMLASWAVFIVFDGVQVVFMFSLRSIGDQIVAGTNGIIAFFLVTGGTGWWLVQAGLGPFALVWASGIGMVAAALLNGARFLVVSSRLRPQS